MPCRERDPPTVPCLKPFLSATHLHFSHLKMWHCMSAIRHLWSCLHVSVALCVCVCVCVYACERALLCQACQMRSCPLEEARTMRSIRAQLSNRRSKPVMHLMLDVVMETQGADFPLHWLPSVYGHFLNYFQERQLKDGRGKISQVTTKIVRRHSKTQKYRVMGNSL